MGFSRRKFLGTSAATMSAAVLGRAGGAQDQQGRPAATKTDEQRRVGPQPLSGAHGGSLLIVFEGLCAAVTDPPKDKSVARKLDVGLVDTSGLKSATVHEHLPTLSIDRSIIREVTGIQPVGADLQNTFFSLKGRRIRFVPPSGTQGLFISDSVPVGADCPRTKAEWGNLNWLLDFRNEVDTSAQAALLEAWRTKTHAVVELRNGSVEDDSLITPDTPGNDGARVFDLPTVGRARALKEQIRAVIETPQLAIHVWPLGGKGDPAGVIKLDCGTLRHVVTVSQLPYQYVNESHNMGDLAALWLLTTGGAADSVRLRKSLPRPTPRFCQLSTTDGCGCCPIPRFFEVDWKGEA